jgi:hypothetical protein
LDICRKSKEGYEISIPKKAYDEIESRLKSFAVFEGAFKEYETLNQTVKRLNNSVNGFINYYAMASKNEFRNFQNFAKQKRIAALRSLLESTFGIEVLGNLDVERRKFLEIEIE